MTRLSSCLEPYFWEAREIVAALPSEESASTELGDEVNQIHRCTLGLNLFTAFTILSGFLLRWRPAPFPAANQLALKVVVGEVLAGGRDIDWLAI